ncbi:LysM peptidoglycan-binding domain-containing protein [Enterococcus faecalis]|nr:LysM peptidoglycan-binding domain-containing protein [Enterococcus faecalis]HDO7720688.1 LysM peptidoglycan-binding domain-containing protein [Enterococcus faecalis]HDO7730393.1 LysM peptidoglycan-binding domain-containing protein [Enterococcus faecalis]HDO7750124.1 LysM peptidoglycan-binding domain-containing protein [Enterococcus faecalis]HDO7757948.1 LysM peptidoglycan-binding domain-containing protein [Enterococcus faecalis]
MRINLKMKKIVTLSLSLLLLTACSNETKQVSKQNSSSTSITSEKKDISDSKKINSSSSESSTIHYSSTQIDETTQKELGGSTYSQILETYTQKLTTTTPILIEELRNEGEPIKGNVSALAEVLNSKIVKLADISNTGISEMASIQLSNKDDYSLYESWANKLTDVYTAEANKLTDLYTKLAAVNTEISTSQQPLPSTQSSSAIEQPQSSEAEQPVYDKVRSGEGARQVAERNGLTLEQLLVLNPGIDSSVFYPGQPLRIK